jgi:ABC-type sugar transport system, periplasmic component
VKKLLLSLMALITVLGMLVSCAKPGNGKVTLNALFMKQAGYSEDEITAGTKDFMAANPNITVNLTFVPYEALEQKIITSAQSGSYDVVLADGPFIAKFAKGGIVQSVPDLAADTKADIFPGALDACVYDGKTWGMPWLNDVKYLYYNKKILKEAGFNAPPKTIDELIAMSKTIKAKKLVEFPIVWAWAQAETIMCDYTILSSAFGGSMFAPDTTPQVTNSDNQAALEFMVNSLKTGISNPKSTEFTEEDVRGVFSGGNAAFALNWTYMYNMAKDPTQSKLASGDVGICAIPGTAKAVSATVNGGMPLCISAGSKHPIESWTYISFLVGKDFQKKYSKNALPIWKSLYTDPDVVANAPEVVAVSKTQYEYIANRPKVAYYSAFSTAMQVKIQEALLGKKSAADALKEGQTEAETLAAKK